MSSNQRTQTGEAILDLGPEDSEEHSLILSAERGIPFRETFRGLSHRFIPGSLVSMGVVFAAMGFLEGSSLGNFVGGVVFTTTLLGLGFGIGLEGLRRWLYKDAGVDGRRSLLAGLLSPLAFWTSAVLLYGLRPIGLLVIGFLMALALFFPWLTPTVEEEQSP